MPDVESTIVLEVLLTRFFCQINLGLSGLARAQAASPAVAAKVSAAARATEVVAAAAAAAAASAAAA